MSKYLDPTQKNPGVHRPSRSLSQEDTRLRQAVQNKVVQRMNDDREFGPAELGTAVDAAYELYPYEKLPEGFNDSDQIANQIMQALKVIVNNRKGQ